MRGIAMMLAIVSAAWLCGCETVKGVGRDIEGASTSVQRAISKSK